jgi:uncharacterized protein (DUF2236 family)
MARVNRERVLLVGGQRALVMQLAHPSVAAGVDQHSDFPARALERLRRTLDLSLTVIYGTPAEVRSAGEAIRAVHDRVTGMAEGTAYRANAPDLLQWVNATLIDTTLVVYERFVRRLTEGERRRYYAETVASAQLFGIPERVVPPDLRAFRRYLGRMLDGNDLRPTDAGRRLIRDVLHPPLPLPLRVPTAAIRRLTLALLPERIRDRFDLRPGPIDRLALAATGTASRTVLPLLPARLRVFSRARLADRGGGVPSSGPIYPGGR